MDYSSMLYKLYHNLLDYRYLQVLNSIWSYQGQTHKFVNKDKKTFTWRYSYQCFLFKYLIKTPSNWIYKYVLLIYWETIIYCHRYHSYHSSGLFNPTFSDFINFALITQVVCLYLLSIIILVQILMQNELARFLFISMFLKRITIYMWNYKCTQMVIGAV
jgi:hypothetical protein